VLQGANGVLMKTDLRYQNGCLYEHHGAWYVRYRQRISQAGGATKRNHASKHLGRSVDFPNILNRQKNSWVSSGSGSLPSE